jgi:hypothetical protein
VGCGVTYKQKADLDIERQKIELEKQKLDLERQKLALEKQKWADNIEGEQRLDAARENEEMCVSLYDILNECHQHGQGRTVEVCADLTLSIAERFAPNFRDNSKTLASFSLMCGKVCSYGSEGKIFLPFSMFQKELCR